MTRGQNQKLSYLEKFFTLLREFFTKNLSLKFISLLFAITSFLVVKNHHERYYESIARVKFIPPEGFALKGNQERFIHVSLKLKNSLFSESPSRDQLLGEVVLPHRKAGKYRVPISKDNFPNLDNRYTLIIDKPYMDIELDVFSHSSIPIQPNITGIPAPNLELARINIEPKNVRVSGARSDIINTKYLTTAPINIEGLQKDQLFRSDIINPENSSLVLETQEADVHVFLENKKSHRTFRAIPIELRGMVRKLNIEMRPNKVNVNIRGPEELLRNINPPDIQAYINISKYKLGWQEIKIKIKLPNGIDITDVSPDKIFVYISK
jgi:YbbR domain-containing protein